MAVEMDAGMLVECNFVCKISDQYTNNVLNIAITTVLGDPVSDVNFAGAIDDVFAPLYKNILAEDGTYWGSKIQVVQPTRYDPQYVITGRGAGTIAGEQLPPQIAGVVAMKTGFASRSRMGRVYLPAATEAENTDTGRPGTTYTAPAGLLMAAYLAGGSAVVGGGTVNWIPVIYSRKFGTITPVTQYNVRTSWGTIRKRSNIGHLDAPPF